MFIDNNYSKIFAIGDIHGDIGPLVICLRDCCKVITKNKKYKFNPDEFDNNLEEEMLKDWQDKSYQEDLNYEWIGGKSAVVLCGDILDNVRGPVHKKPQEYPFEEARILKFINAINKKAVKEGGKIFKVLGNHDMYNLNGLTRTRHSTYVSDYAKNYEGYKDGAEDRLAYFNKGNPGAKLIGEDGAYVFLMIKDFIFVHGGISSSLLKANNILQVNESLNKYIYDKDNNTFDKETQSVENSLTFSNDDNDGLVFDRFFGFKSDKTEEEMCSILYNRFKTLCNDIKKNNKDLIKCNHNKMKLVIGHCNQNKTTTDTIYKSSFSKLAKINKSNEYVFSEEFTAPVYSGEPSKDTVIYGITVGCGDRVETSYDINKPSVYRIDVGMSRGFNLEPFTEEYGYSRTPQVLKIEYINGEPNVSIVKSTLANTLIHLKDFDKNPYERKYLKYKAKYLNLKKNEKN